MTLQDAMMLASADQQRLDRRFVALSAKRRRKREICRLRRAAQKDDAPSVCAKRLRDRGPRVFEQRLGRPALGMNRGRIAERLQRIEHRRACLRAQRRCRVVVEIDAGGHGPRFRLPHYNRAQRRGRVLAPAPLLTGKEGLRPRRFRQPHQIDELRAVAERIVALGALRARSHRRSRSRRDRARRRSCPKAATAKAKRTSCGVAATRRA